MVELVEHVREPNESAATTLARVYERINQPIYTRPPEPKKAVLTAEEQELAEEIGFVPDWWNED